jgi:AcrR family transcriptional regulator
MSTLPRNGIQRATKPAPKAATQRAAKPAAPAQAVSAPARRRLGTAERESQIVAGAVRFFADRGLDGQLRDLARDIGITHALLYHYFPTKQALIDRVYHEIFEGRWNPDWERMLDDPKLSPEDKLVSFYCAYGRAIFVREWVRIFIHSGLSDRSIPDRFFALLREKLFPRVIRETRRHCGVSSRAKPSAREQELMMGLHGGIFYNGMRRWVYEQAVHSELPAEQDDIFIRDRVRAYLLSAHEVLWGAASAPAAKPKAARRRTTEAALAA